jgi:chromosome partitioning protein
MATETQHRPNQESDPVAGRAVSVNILKGGVGKSAISMNLADRLAARDNTVLYMDLDPNGHVTYGLGYDDVYQDRDHDLSEVILDNPSKDPSDIIYETDWGFDFVPASVRLEDLNIGLKSASHSSQRLHSQFLQPLMANDQYDYCVMDGGGERSKVADNAFFAAKQSIIPIEPGAECLSGFKRTWQRIVQPLREYQPFEILAIVPNKLSQRIDYHNDDRELIEYLNTSEQFAEKVPNFARLTPEELDQIDTGELRPLPKPGIRQDTDFSKAYKQGMPLAQYNPDSPTIDHLDELAHIVEERGILR